MATAESPGEDPVKSRLEAIAAAIGAVLALCTLGVIVWDGIRDRDRPALVTLRSEAIHAHEAGFVVEIVAFTQATRPPPISSSKERCGRASRWSRRARRPSTTCRSDRSAAARWYSARIRDASCWN